MHEKTVSRAYLMEMAAGFAVYGIILVGTIKFGRPMAEGPLRTVVLMLPMLGFLGVVWAIGRHLMRVDEYIRKFTLENIAIAAAVTAAATFTYGFLETAGYEKLSMFTVWCVMGGTWWGSTVVRAFMNR
ncbi:hypothetical protein [Massilia sp. TWP1-3-3]|uniref:hypothetical protein n=1 Tax=Massilia sp. TWP1-3-3 TaxID=2804573 RepID=UPI003CED42FB